MLKIKAKSFFSIVCFITAFLGSTQEVDPANVTDVQLKEGLEKARQSGYTQQQIESMARARGLSEVEISNLRERVSNLQQASNSSEITDALLREELGEDFSSEVSDLLLNDLNGDSDKLKVYGSELFSNKLLTFNPSVNIPTPENYILGSGDQIVIDVWGASENTYQLTIGPEGTVKIPNLGPIFLSGLKIEEASKKLISRLTQIYSGLRDTEDRKKNTYAQVSLSRIRSIKINLVGEVSVPGTYTISSLSTVMHALYQGGGLTYNGSYRDIQVFRSGEKIGSFDIYSFLSSGEITNNFILKDQDIIKVPIYEKRVKIDGEIKNSAIYELKEGESLQDLMGYASGPTDEAYLKLITVRRKTDFSKKILTIKSENFKDFQLQSGDDITISKILDAYENRVTIRGAVWRPGEYELTPGLTLSELIQKAEGLSSDAFMERGQILRNNEDLTLKNIDFSVKDIVDGNKDFELKAEDLISIKSTFELHSNYTVTIQGEVQDAGVFQYRDSLTVEDLIFEANGFKESAAKSFVEVARRITDKQDDGSNISMLFNFEINENLGLEDGASSFLLMPFDLVIVRKSPFFEEREMVKIEGEVRYPGNYAIRSKSETIADVIERAGGFTNDAYAKGGTLIRKTEYFDEGEAAKVKKLRLQGLEKYDSTSLSGTFIINDAEAIAIELDEILSNKSSPSNVILKNGDIISIPKKLQTVRIRGEVYFSSNIIFDKSWNMKDYINASGGNTQDAKIKKSYVIYPNGRARITKNFFFFKNYPKIQPGSEIIIPRKADKRKLLPQEIIGITSGIGTIALIINSLVK